jgi:ribosome biogenesis GTPase A
MAIQWFPGHMNKTRRLLAQHMTQVDAVLEIVDARAPLSSRNPMLNDIIGRKPRLILLNKSDMTDAIVLKEWQSYFQKQGIASLTISVKTRKNLDRLKGEVAKLVKRSDKTREKPPSVLIVGIPNCGKSSLINALMRDKRAKTADSPGVTRDVLLYRMNGLDMVDSPGALWPNLEDQMVAARLAALGSVKDEIYLATEALSSIYPYLYQNYLGALQQRYGQVSADFEELLQQVAVRYGRNVQDKEAISLAVLRDLRAGKLGLICLERPQA